MPRSFLLLFLRPALPRRTFRLFPLGMLERVRRARVEVELLLQIELFRAVEGGKFGDGNLVGGHGFDLVFGDLLLILAALDAARKGDLIPHLQIFDEPRVPAPGDARDIVGLVIGARLKGVVR